jgi:hypothetical protein
MDKNIRYSCQSAATYLWSAISRAEKLGDAELAASLTKIAVQIPTQQGYTEKPEPRDHILTVEEFENDCAKTYLMDDDGHGHPMKDGLIDPDIVIAPSARNSTIPKDATHIVWYNR